MRYYKFFTFFVLLFFTLQLRADTITILNWDAYLSEEVKVKWEQSTNNNIEIIKFDSDEKRNAILLNTRNDSVDIAVVDEVVAERFGQEGMFVKLDEDNLPSLKHIGSFWRERCGNYAAPYLWGTLGIIYRSDKITTPPNSWGDILKPTPDLKGHIGMLDDYTDLLAPALFLNGDPLNTENKASLKKAFETLKNQIPSILTYEYPITFLQSNPKADDLYMAVAYGGDQYAINEIVGQEGLWKYAIPQEGTVLWADCLAIPIKSKHKKQSLAFIEYLNTPKIAAENAETLYYATPNESALKLLSDPFKKDPEVFPAIDILQKSGLYEELSNSNINQRIRISNAIINIHESK